MRFIALVVTLILAFSSLPVSASTEGADLVLIEKSKRLLTLKRGDKQLAQYTVALGGTPVGPKRCIGDSKTPEGTYRIIGRNSKSAFYRSLKLSYPTKEDRENAKRLGCSPGGDIMIHGLPNGRGWIGAAHRQMDWTLGCIAVTNSEIDEIWKFVADGTAVQIKP